MKRTFSTPSIETFSAYLLLPIALIAIYLGQNQSGDFLNSQRYFHGVQLSISTFVLDYLLSIFFFKIGLELKYELTQGVLRDRKILSISAMSAGLGMAIPVAIFLLLTSALHITHQGWGIIMATDLPLVLALVAILKRNKMLPFILALATLDDIGAIVVLSFVKKSVVQWQYLLVFILVFICYLCFSHFVPSISVLFLIFALGVIVGNQAGIPVSLSAVLFGISTLTSHKGLTTVEKRFLKILEPISAFLVIPAFVFVILYRKFHISTAALAGGLLLVLIISRLLGKPLGIFIGIALGQKLFKSKIPLSSGEGWLMGLLGTLGLSVSLIFAQGQLKGQLLNTGILAILFTIPLGILATVLFSFYLKRKGQQSQPQL